MSDVICPICSTQFNVDNGAYCPNCLQIIDIHSAVKAITIDPDPMMDIGCLPVGIEQSITNKMNGQMIVTLNPGGATETGVSPADGYDVEEPDV